MTNWFREERKEEYFADNPYFVKFLKEVDEMFVSE
jgi:hypothetical protein